MSILIIISLLGDKKAGRQTRTLLDARTYSHMHTDRQIDRMTLPFEFTALGWSKSLLLAFFGTSLFINGLFYNTPMGQTTRV